MRSLVVPPLHAVLLLATLVVMVPRTEAATVSPPSPLLAIDSNRETVIEKVVVQWGDALVRSNAGITAEQLRELLRGMRADHLLAASLAGSLDGLRNVVSASLLPEADVKPSLLHAKALGDTNQDVVYVPVTPCRLVETRGTFAAVYQGSGPFISNEVRTYTLQGGNGVCLTQLPASITPGAVQMQVFGIPTSVASGDIEILPQGGTFGSTATLVYLGNNTFTSAAATSPVNVGNKQISVQVRGGGAHVAIDVVGYFRAPVGGYVSSVTAGTGLSGGGSGAVTLNVDTTVIQNRVAGICPAGSSIRTINVDGTVVCEADDTGTGTVTSVGSGTGLTGGPITTTGTLSADTTYLQRRVSSSCAVGSSIRAIAADGTVTCQTDGPANAYVQNGNAFGATGVLGLTDNNALDIRVNNTRAMRYEPHAISPNVVGGHPLNSVSANVRGATIAGGGVSGGDPEPDLQVEAPNRVFDSYGTVGGGYANEAGLQNADPIDAVFATVGGGRQNRATGYSATVAGGSSSTASGFGSFVGGGNANSATGTYSAIAGGQLNTVGEYYAFIGAGAANQATGTSSSILAGNYNIASGLFSVAWGNLSESRGDYSVAIGRRAKTFVGANNAVGGFVWADSNDFDFAASTDNRFQARATGGVYFVTAINASGGATESLFIASTGDVTSTGEINAVAFNPTSDRNAKQDFEAVDNDAVLAAVASLPLASWSYRSDPQATRHIGPTAQDFRAAFNVGRDDKSIATVDADGVALAAIQALNAKLESKVSEQSREIAELRRAIEELSRQRRSM